MAVVHLDHMTVRSYDSSFTRRQNGASTIIFNNNNNKLVKLENDAVRVAVALRLALDVCVRSIS